MDTSFDEIFLQLRQKVDLDQIAAMAEQYADDPRQTSRSKYLRKGRGALTTAIRRALRLGLDRHRGFRILDIGTGIGFFPYVCMHLGHDCETIDVDVEGVYGDMIRLLGVHQKIAGIYARKPIPVRGPYDLICAFAIAFCDAPDGSRWSADDWDYFVEDAKTKLSRGGRLAMHLNPTQDGARYSPEMLKVFLEHGAEVDDAWVVIPKG